MIDAPPAYDAGAQPSPIVASAVGVDGVQPTMTVAAAPVQQSAEATLEQRIHTMQLELDLPEEIVRDLLSVSGTDIVVIADDSGSKGPGPMCFCIMVEISSPLPPRHRARLV